CRGVRYKQRAFGLVRWRPAGIYLRGLCHHSLPVAAASVVTMASHKLFLRATLSSGAGQRSSSSSANVAFWHSRDLAARPSNVRSVRQERTCRGDAATAGFDPNVWSGRALQEDFFELGDMRSCINVSGL